MAQQEGAGTTQSIEDLVRQILGDLLSKVMQTGGGMIANFVTPMLRNLTGNDLAWDTPVMSSATAEGVYRHQLDRQVNTMQQTLSREMQQKVTENLAKDIERTKYSYDDWISVNPGGTRDEYEDFITAKTRQAMDAGIYAKGVGFLNGTFDLQGSAGVGEALGRTAANFARQGVYRNDPNALLFGKSMAAGVFGDNPYNKEAWGGLSQTAVAELASVVSSETDFLRGIDPSNSRQMETAAKQFSDMVHQYAVALSPLKDVFGDDMASMVKSLQQMSGMGMSQLGPMRASIMATQLADRRNANMYSTTYLTQNVGTARSLLDATEGLSSIHYLNAQNLGTRASDMARGTGVMPSYMRQDQWENSAMKLAYQTSVSQATDDLAMDYSIWAQKKMDAEEADQVNFQNFLNEMQPYIEQGMDMRAAAGELSGARNHWEKLEGKSYDFYTAAITSGEAARASAGGALQESRNAVKQTLKMDAGLNKLVQRVADTADDDSEVQSLDRYIDLSMQLLESRSDLHGLRGAELTKAISEATVVNEDGEEVKLDNAAVRAVSGIVERMFNEEADSNVFQYIQQAHAMQGEDDMLNYSNEAGARRERYANIGKAMFSPGTQAIGELLSGGFSIEAIEERLRNANMIAQGDPDNAAAIISAAASTAVRRYGKGDTPESEEARDNYIRRFYKYATSEEGMTSQSFQENMRKYREAMESGDTKAAEAAQRRLDAELTLGKKAVADIESMEMYDENGRRIAGSDVARTVKYKDKSGQEVEVQIQGKGDPVRDKFEMVEGMTADEIALMKVDSAIYGLETRESASVAKEMEDTKKRRDKAKKRLDKAQAKADKSGGKNLKDLEQAQLEYDELDEHYNALVERASSSKNKDVWQNRSIRGVYDDFRKQLKDLPDGVSAAQAWTAYRDEFSAQASLEMNQAYENLERVRQKHGSGKPTKEMEQAQAAYDAAEAKYNQQMRSLEAIDREFGTSKRDMVSAPTPSDNLDLITVLGKLNDTLDRLATDGNGLMRGGRGDGVSTQDSE